MNWLGWILWYINHCRLFNTKSFFTFILNIYDLVRLDFYSISTIVGYLMPNPVFTYILNIYELVRLDFMVYQPL